MLIEEEMEYQRLHGYIRLTAEAVELCEQCEGEGSIPVEDGIVSMFSPKNLLNLMARQFLGFGGFACRRAFPSRQPRSGTRSAYIRIRIIVIYSGLVKTS